MANCNTVSVLCPNGHRQKIKVSPQMTLIQLIQEVCKKQNLDSKIHVIKHQRKTLDNALTVRFANLPNNAHLELTELAEEQIHTVKKCVVALQLQNGDRLVHEFPADQSLFNILEHWKQQANGRLSYNEHMDAIVCIYANQEIKGLEKLKSTTLSMIGLNGGRGVIRVILPPSLVKDETEIMEGVVERENVPSAKSEAVPMATAVNPSIVPKLSTEEMDVSSRSASSVSMVSQPSHDDLTMQCLDTSTETTNQKTPNKKSPKAGRKTGKNQVISMDVEQCDITKCKPEPVEAASPQCDKDQDQSTVSVQAFSGVGRTLSETGPEIKKARLQSPVEDKTKVNFNKLQGNTESAISSSVGDRDVVVFKLGDGTSISQDDVSDEFFEVTVDDLRLMLKDLKNERNEETPLLTKNLRENKEKEKMEKYEKVIIRVYFPDRTVLQAIFSPTEKVQVLYNFVKNNLENTNTDFYLYTTPPRTVLDKLDVSLYQAKLFPAAITHFGTRETQDGYLSSALMQRLCDSGEANNKISKRPSSSTPTTTDNQQQSQKETEPKTITSQNATTSSTNTAQEENKKVAQNTNKKPKWFKL